MLPIVVLLMGLTMTVSLSDDPSLEQIIDFKERNEGRVALLKTSYGMPVEYKQFNSTLKRNVLANDFFLEGLTHFSRERIPERIVHALGSGAKGYFKVTGDITNICKAKLFSEIGKMTRVTVRFSLVHPNLGGSDTVRDIRGFAIKFYTEEGNFDLVGLNTPVFSLKDPLFFTSFIRAQKRNPRTNMRDPNTIWDFITSRPESMHLFMITFSDRGIPDGYRYMPGFGIHAFEVINKLGEKSYVKFHLVPDGGIRNLLSDEAKEISGRDPDYANRDLYNAIASGNYPSWTLAVQIVSMKEMKKCKVNLFDLTRLWAISEYPLFNVGKLVLNKNPTNYFAEVEQIALNPVHLVPGIRGPPDEIYESRRISYRDSQFYRLGANFNNIRINCPIGGPVYTYNRDGRPPVGKNGEDSPNYYPNSFNGAEPYVDDTEPGATKICQNAAPNNIDQIRDMYNEMADDERSRLAQNIVETLGKATTFLQERAVALFTKIDPDFGDRVTKELQANGSQSY